MVDLLKGLMSTTTSILVLVCSVCCGHRTSLDKPNFVIFLADDMGFGDIQSFGNALSTTPNIDALERNGLKFTQFYSSAPMCSPARAGLLTGRYPVRSGIWTADQVNGSQIFHQEMVDGLPHQEITIPEMLAKQGYKSALIGKWHLGIGRNREYLPLHHGFDEYFGIAVSHKDCPCVKCYFPNDNCTNTEHCNDFHAPCQLLLGDEIIEQPVDLISLAARQARAARSLIQQYSCTSRPTPFLLLYSFFQPHIPHFAGKQFRNSTLGGVYTDSLAELDWQVGEVMQELRRSGIIDNTLVIFTSDNGAALPLMEEAGFSGVMKCGKGSTFEGGSRVPTIAYWRGRISSGISTELLSHMDIWPTLRSLSGSSPEDFDVTLDGFDFSDVLLKNGKSRRNSLLYYSSSPLPYVGPYAVRNTRYKAHFIVDDIEKCDQTYNATSSDVGTYFKPPLLFDLLLDPEERNDLSSLNQSKTIIEEMTRLRKTGWGEVKFGVSVLMRTDESIQLCCNSGCEPYPSCCVCVSNYTTEMFPVGRNCQLSPLPFQTSDRRNKC